MSAEAPPAAPAPPLVDPVILENILRHLGLDSSPAGVAELQRAKIEVSSSAREGVTTRTGAGGAPSRPAGKLLT